MRRNEGSVCSFTEDQIGWDEYRTPTLVSPADGAVLSAPEVPLSFSVVFGATRYRVEVDDDPAFSCPEYTLPHGVATEATTFFLPRGHYYWRVRAGDRWNSGPWSAVRSFQLDYPAAVPPVAGIVTGPGILSDCSVVNPTWVRSFERDGDPLGATLIAYPGATGGVKVAAGDVNGDGIDEIITGKGLGDPNEPRVRIWRPDGTLLLEFVAYPNGAAGVNVAAGDVDGDGIDEIITGKGAHDANGSRVRIWRGDGTLVGEFWAYPGTIGGVNVAAGDIDGDGDDEILTGKSPRREHDSLVRLWDANGTQLGEFVAYPGAGSGVNVAAGDIDGDGADEVVTGKGADFYNDALVRTWRPDGTNLGAFQAYPGSGYGVNVGAGDLDGDGIDEIVTGEGLSAGLTGSRVRIWRADGMNLGEIMPYPDGGPFGATGGANVAIADFVPGTGAATEASLASGLAVDIVFPNPAQSSSVIVFAVPPEASPEVIVFDVLGRVAGRGTLVPVGLDRFAAHWDLRGEGGERVARGTYLIRIRAAGQEAVRKVIVAPS